MNLQEFSVIVTNISEFFFVAYPAYKLYTRFKPYSAIYYLRVFEHVKMVCLFRQYFIPSKYIKMHLQEILLIGRNILKYFVGPSAQILCPIFLKSFK